MKQHEMSRIAVTIKKNYPELFNEVVQQTIPTLNDTSQLQVLYDYYQITYPQPSPSDRDGVYKHRLVFVSAILELFCPSALYQNALVNKRICGILRGIMGYNHRQSISNFVADARAYIKGQTFRAKIKDLSLELKSSLEIEL